MIVKNKRRIECSSIAQQLYTRRCVTALIDDKVCCPLVEPSYEVIALSKLAALVQRGQSKAILGSISLSVSPSANTSVD